MTIQLAEIAALVEGRLVGTPDLVCHGANPPGEAIRGEITMLDHPRRASSIAQSQALAVITGEEVDVGGRPQIVVANPRQAFATVVALFRPPIEQVQLADGVHPTAQIAETALIHPRVIVGADAKIGERTRIMPGAVIMPRCVIGDDCVIYANVTLYEYTQVGNRVVIHAGVVIGAHGFGYRPENGQHVLTPQLGYVAIESDVEIGAGTTIDRGTYGATRIGEGTKIDNQVMIGHNCQIGRHNLLCSQVGIAGSSRTGDYVVLAGQVGLADHITLGDHVTIGAQAGVMADCPESGVYFGSPATNHRDQMQIMAVQRRLPQMRKEMKELRRELDQLKQNAQPGAVGHDDCSGASSDNQRAA